jgi:hypothetical protein
MVLIALLGLIVFLILYNLRTLDDNRLTSWLWVFSEINVLTIFLILTAGYVLAFGFTKLSIPEHKPIAFLFLSSFIATTFLWSEPELIVDTSRYFVQAKHLELYGIGYFVTEWGKEIMVWTDLPLIPLLYGLVFKFLGESRLSIQIFNTLLFSGTVVLTYLIGKQLWDRTVGLYGGLLLLGMPYLLTQVPLMLVDVPTMFFLTLAIFTTIMALRQDGVLTIAAAAIAITLAMLSKYSAWLMLSILPIIALCHLSIGRKRMMQRASMIALGAIILVGIFIITKFDVVSEQLKLLLSYQLPGLERWGESLGSTFLFQIHPFISLAALFSVYVSIKKRDVVYAIICWLPLLVIILEINRSRYILVTLPMLALMAAYGVREIKNIRISRFFVSSTVVSALVIAIFGYLPFLQNTSASNIKQAGKYLDSINADRIEVVVLPQIRSSINPAVSVPLLDLYTKKDLVFRYDEKQVVTPVSIRKSPLRFTWQYKNPEYFKIDASVSGERIPIAIILCGYDQVLSDQIMKKITGYRLARELAATDRVFQYRTIIRVYQPVFVT